MTNMCIYLYIDAHPSVTNFKSWILKIPSLYSTFPSATSRDGATVCNDSFCPDGCHVGSALIFLFEKMQSLEVWSATGWDYGLSRFYICGLTKRSLLLYHSVLRSIIAQIFPTLETLEPKFFGTIFFLTLLGTYPIQRRLGRWVSFPILRHTYPEV